MPMGSGLGAELSTLLNLVLGEGGGVGVGHATKWNKGDLMVLGLG